MRYQRDYFLNGPELLGNTEVLGGVRTHAKMNIFFGPFPFSRQVIQSLIDHHKEPWNFALIFSKYRQLILLHHLLGELERGTRWRDQIETTESWMKRFSDETTRNPQTLWSMTRIGRSEKRLKLLHCVMMTHAPDEEKSKNDKVLRLWCAWMDDVHGWN